MLHDWSVSAEEHPNGNVEFHKRRMSSNSVDAKPETLSTMAVGMKPPFWGEKEYWIRERFPAIKKEFQSFGEGRHSKRTLEDVGFSFEQWKRIRALENMGLQ